MLLPNDHARIEGGWASESLSIRYGWYLSDWLLVLIIASIESTDGGSMWMRKVTD